MCSAWVILANRLQSEMALFLIPLESFIGETTSTASRKQYQWRPFIKLVQEQDYTNWLEVFPFKPEAFDTDKGFDEKLSISFSSGYCRQGCCRVIPGIQRLLIMQSFTTILNFGLVDVTVMND